MDFCRHLPKLELHAHLNGSLSENTLKQLKSTPEDILEYQKLKNTPINQRTLNDCFKIFNIAHKVTKTPENLYVATKNVIQEFSDDNVIYLELRTTAKNEELMTFENYIETVVRAILENENEILVKLILSINRQENFENCQKNFETILKMHQKYPDIIKGLDLSGNPHFGNFSNFRNYFVEARNNGLMTTIHCGEIENNVEVEEILKFHPERIGHAPFLHPNYGGCRENWALLKKLRIHTEFCLTSNIISGTTESFEKHHVLEWISNDLPFSFNTDDKGVFNTELSKEYECAMEYLKLTPENLWKICYNSIDYTFASPEEKMMLKRKLEDWKGENLGKLIL